LIKRQEIVNEWKGGEEEREVRGITGILSRTHALFVCTWGGLPRTGVQK
jgi:hypothetical protein